MTETVNDTETFTVTLTSPEPAVTCTGNSPHYGTGCALLKHYDSNNDGIIDSNEMNTATNDYDTGSITKEEYDFVRQVYGDSAPINMTCAGCYTPPAAPAQGQLESLSYPTSVKHGADVKVAFRIHNTGGQTGTFIARLYQGSTKVRGDWRAVIRAGTTPPSDAVIHATAPGSGTSVSYALKLFLET